MSPSKGGWEERSLCHVLFKKKMFPKFSKQGVNDFHGDGKQGGGRSTPISKMSARDKCEVFGNYLDVAPKILGHVSHLGCRSTLLCGEL